MKILAVEPYFYGSHRDFLEGLSQHSAHEFEFMTNGIKNWKWQMRTWPLLYADLLKELSLIHI